MRPVRRMVCIAVALVAAACASEGDEDDLRAQLEDEADPAGEPGGDGDRDLAADLAVAEGAVLTLEDVPDGWQEAPDESEGADGSGGGDAGDDYVSDGLAACIGAEAPDDDGPLAESVLESPQGEQVGSEVTLTASPDDAHAVMALLADEAAPGCFGDLFQSLLEQGSDDPSAPEDFEGGDVTVDRTDAAAGIGDESVGLRATISYSVGEARGNVYADVVVVRVGRAGITMSFNAMSSPFDDAEVARLTRIVADRVGAADAG